VAIGARDPDATAVGAERQVVGREAGVEAPEHPRPAPIRDVHDHERPRTFPEGDPDTAPARADREVMRAEADEDPADDSLAGQLDHVELTPSVVGDVGPLTVRAEGGQVRRAEAPKHTENPQSPPVEERDRARTRADDDRREAGAADDVLRIRGDRDPLSHPAAL